MPAIAHENKILGNINTLNDLTDVNLTSPQDGQVLTRRNGKWVNDDPQGGDTSDLIKWSEATTSVKKNLLPNKAVSQTISGVTFTVNADKSVTANGTATADIFYVIHYDSSYSDVILSGCPANGSLNTYRIQYSNFVDQSFSDDGNGVYIPTTKNAGNWRIVIFIGNGQTVNNFVFKPMIRLASIADDTYEPYIPDNEELNELKADKTQITNPNLLDNPWFTVNQRGQNSYTSGTSRYTVDRWQASSTESVAVNSNSSVTLSNASASNNGLFQQYLEGSLRDNLLGRTVTVSAIVDDVLYNDTFTMPATVQSSYQVGYITIGDITLRLRFSASQILCFYFEHNANSSNSHTIKAVKLEVGSISTLALDTAPNYATELLKCQRYFVRYLSGQGTIFPIAFGQVASATSFRCMITVPVEMRTTPTISVTGLENMRVYANGSNNTPSALTIHSVMGNQIRLLATTSSLTQNHLGSLCTSTQTDCIDLSADL